MLDTGLPPAHCSRMLTAVSYGGRRWPLTTVMLSSEVRGYHEPQLARVGRASRRMFAKGGHLSVVAVSTIRCRARLVRHLLLRTHFNP